MKKMIAMAVTAMISMCFGGNLYAQTSKPPATKDPKVLVAYFSWSGNTRTVAEQLHSIVGGDIFEIKTVQAYPTGYDATVDQARKEQDSQARPALTAKVEGMESYDLIFLGYPNWWATMPMALFTFLEQYDLSGKTIIPFCTHEGSGLGRSAGDLSKLAPNSTIGNGLAIRGSRVGSARPELMTWVKQFGFEK